jgi:hypothetical protein
VCSPNLIEAAKSYFLIIAAIIEEHISVVGEVVDKHDLAIEIAEGDKEGNYLFVRIRRLLRIFHILSKVLNLGKDMCTSSERW